MSTYNKNIFKTLLLLFILTIVGFDSYAQTYKTVTYNDTTIVFNVEEIANELTTNTDLSPEEIPAVLNNEYFWYSLFPPSKLPVIPTAGLRSVMIDTTCLGFDDLTHGAAPTYEITDGSPWTPFYACNNGGYPLTFNGINWGTDNDCQSYSSNNAFSVVYSDPNVYDSGVTKNGIPIIQLDAPSGKSQFIRIGDRSGGRHGHRIVGNFTVNAATPILKYNFAIAMQDVGGGHGGDVLGNTGKPYFTIRISDQQGDEIPCSAYSVVGVASNNSELDSDNILVNNSGGFLINWKTNSVDLTDYIGQQVEIDISVVECDAAGHTAWAYLDMSCEESAIEIVIDGNCLQQNFSTFYTGNYADEVYLWDFGDGNTSTDPNPTHAYANPGTYIISLDLDYTNLPNGNDTGTQEECNFQDSIILVVTDDCCAECQPPVFDAPPADESVNCTNGLPPMYDLEWTSNCTGTGTVAGVETYAFQEGCVHVIERVWEYTDVCGNTITATQAITITDNTAAQFNVPVDATYDCLSEVPPMQDIIYTNDCTGQTSVIPGVETNDGNECPMVITREWNYSDNQCPANSEAISQTITVSFSQYQCENGIESDTCISLPPICTECESSFAPMPGKKYVVSAWVKESNSMGVSTYENANITLYFEGLGSTLGPFFAKGAIIDGWQRIEEEFTVPSGAVKIKVQLNNADNSKNAFFDDIRIHPFDANMKSFVYDPVTLRLSAELDERNYATFYEYDEEGALIRVKKETSRGVMTIQEARNAVRKQ